jgi:hypothetical protein
MEFANTHRVVVRCEHDAKSSQVSADSMNRARTSNDSDAFEREFR